MYSHTFFVTSVRARVFAPQIAASASLSFFGAKMPFFAFFIAVRVLRVAFVMVVFVVATVVLATVVLVVI